MKIRFAFCFNITGSRKDFHPIQVIQERITKGKYEPITNTVDVHINHIRFIFQNRHQLTDNESRIKKP